MYQQFWAANFTANKDWGSQKIFGVVWKNSDGWMVVVVVVKRPFWFNLIKKNYKQMQTNVFFFQKDENRNIFSKEERLSCAWFMNKCWQKRRRKDG